jgi:hypothetical protein
MLRRELPSVKASLERELGTLSLNCSKCGLDGTGRRFNLNHHSFAEATILLTRSTQGRKVDTSPKGAIVARFMVWNGWTLSILPSGMKNP